MACSNTPPAIVERVPIPGIWQNLTNTLDGVVRNSTYDDHVPTIESFLMTIVCPLQPQLNFIEEAIRCLYNTQGTARIEELASSLYLSQRQLDRQFKEQVGISPKRLARLIRFEGVVRQLLNNPDSRFDDLAFEFGYTDTAHLSNDFKALADRTPSDFAALVREGRATEIYKVPEPRIIYSLCTVYVKAHGALIR